MRAGSLGGRAGAHRDSLTGVLSPLQWLCPSVLPFTMRRVSVGVRGFSGMPEEAVTFTRASQAIETSSRAPSGAAVPTVFYGWHHDDRVAFRNDALSMSIAPATGEVWEAERERGIFNSMHTRKWKEGERQILQMTDVSCWHYLSQNRTVYWDACDA